MKYYKLNVDHGFFFKKNKTIRNVWNVTNNINNIVLLYDKIIANL